ncbi:sensor histidine kinase [uncultured Eubacterium sp.]|uniref:sensor histidine kinase n=1 Tax=uncultured Eubacterium sp. TaxID=165185 RepID=UPI0026099BEA|nr:sensor histidine kinase [uncultured Eubacterium sp.]
MFKHSKTKLSVLIIAIVIFGVIFSTLASTLFFSVSYKNSMFSSAYVTSKQSVAQADETVSNYIFSIKSKLDNLCIETDKCNDAASLQKVISTASRLEDDIYCVSVYDMQGNVLSNGNDTDENIKDGLTDLSFDKSVYSNLKDGYAISQPHVNTLYQNKYPWVVTIAKKEYSNLFSQQVFVAIDFKFSSIAKYIDKVSIGQRGYCYIVNSKGQIIYHPQQQMLFSGLKEENTFEISELSDGIHRKKDNIYNISSLDSCNWKIVGVSFNDEITQAVKSQVAVGLIFALLFSAFMSAVIYFLLSRTVTRPVRRLVASMQKFEKQAETFEYKADMSNVAEFQTLSTSFEHMVLMIQSLVEKVHNEEIVLRKTELKALQAQINPHFLYNTLDSIQWMCEQDNSKDAVKMVGALAKLFRISISHGNEFIAISDELKHAESYLIIQSYRYKNQFTYSFDVDKSVLDCMCNKITIQPFIENAIYHGLDRMVDEGEIKIIVERRGKDIAIIVKDNGLGMTEEQCKAVLQKGRSDSKGIGVKNVDDRLKIYFGEEYGITIDSELDVGTTVTIKIPKIEKGHENEY